MNEITFSMTLQYANAPKNIPQQSLGVSGKATISGENVLQKTQLIPTTAGGTALNVSGLATIGFLQIKNNDATNYVDILTAVSGTPFARLQPGQGTQIPLHPGITAPAALANTASVLVQFMALEQ